MSVNWSVLVLLWLFTWSLAASLPGTAPGYSVQGYWVAGACGATVLLASLLGHELAHAVVARRAGVKVLGVTLWLFGGVTRLGSAAKTPRTAFRIAVSGPATSMALAAVFAGVAAVATVLGVGHIVIAVSWWLAVINLMLGLFNMLPGAPLDGGQVLRAWLWRRHGDAARATEGATRAGHTVAVILIVLGLVQFLAGATVAGVWMVFIGWFLFTAARADEARAFTSSALANVRVADVMTADPQTAPAWITVDDFIEHYLLGDRHSAYPVQDRDGSIFGLITLAQLRAVTPSRRASTTVGEIAMPLGRVLTASPDEPVTALLEHLGAGPNRALVVVAGRIIGIVTTTDLVRLVDVYRLARPRADVADG